MCEALPFKPRNLYEQGALSGQLSTTRSLVGGECTRCAHPRVRGFCCVCKWQEKMKSTGAVQVIARAGPWESETPCQRCHYYAFGFNDRLSTARSGGRHQSLSAVIKWGSFSVTSHRHRTFIYIFVFDIFFPLKLLGEISFLCLVYFYPYS